MTHPEGKKKSAPCGVLAPRLWPPDGREHRGHPATDLPLELYSNVRRGDVNPSRIPHQGCTDGGAAHECEVLLDACAARPNGKSDTWFALKAILHFHFGRADEAFSLTRDVHSEAETFGSHLSLGFLALWRGQAAKAIEHYTASPAMPCDPRIVMQVVRFFPKVIESNPDKPQLRWGLAFVNDKYLDQSRALQDYQQFLNECGGRFAQLREYAQERLVALQASGENSGMSPAERLVAITRRPPRSGPQTGRKARRGHGHTKKRKKSRR